LEPVIGVRLPVGEPVATTKGVNVNPPKSIIPPTSSCLTHMFPEIIGASIFEAKSWERVPVTCDCCGTGEHNDFFTIQVIRWGDDWIKTKRFNYKICPACRKDHNALAMTLDSDTIPSIIDIVPQTIVFSDKYD
jgi:hypothetical protein